MQNVNRQPVGNGSVIHRCSLFENILRLKYILKFCGAGSKLMVKNKKNQAYNVSKDNVINPDPQSCKYHMQHPSSTCRINDDYEKENIPKNLLISLFQTFCMYLISR